MFCMSFLEINLRDVLVVAVDCAIIEVTIGEWNTMRYLFICGVVYFAWSRNSFHAP
jgi:hypothetical protein